jgi:hypothetical protein
MAMATVIAIGTVVTIIPIGAAATTDAAVRMSAAEASAVRTRAVAAKSHDGGVRHSTSPFPLPSFFPPPR